MNIQSRIPAQWTEYEMALRYASGRLDEPERAEFESRLERDAALLRRMTEVLDARATDFVRQVRFIQRPAPAVWRRITSSLFPPDISASRLAALGVANADFLALLDEQGVVLWGNPAFSQWAGPGSGPVRKSAHDRQAEMETISRLTSALREGWAAEANAIFHSRRPGLTSSSSILVRITPISEGWRGCRAFLAIGRALEPRSED